MELVIISGMSGAGKSRVVAVLEDAGFYCIDNMPAALIPKFTELCFQTGGKIEKMALVTDIRSLAADSHFAENLASLKDAGYDYKLLFLDADDDVLISRYKETRRPHPLSERFHGRMRDSVLYERALMRPIREAADYVIDTSKTTLFQLKEEILSILVKGEKAKMFVNVMSFGFKYGVPNDADLVFDVRCLPNPFYVLDLKHKTGQDQEVFDYVFNFESSKNYFEKIADMVKFLIPLFFEEGKAQATIAIGCTGGRHRSVSFARRLDDYLNENGIANSMVTHRDITK